jgi:hypothetical protein
MGSTGPQLPVRLVERDQRDRVDLCHVEVLGEESVSAEDDMTTNNPYIGAANLQHEKTMLDLEEKGVEAIRQLCRRQHAPSIGGMTMCVCGAPCGGSLACRGFRALYELWEPRFELRRQQINYATAEASSDTAKPPPAQ